MAKMKPRCPACSARMRAKDKHCSACGRPVLVKSAGPATVTEIRRAQLLREIHDESNPDQREVYTRQLTDLLRGGAA